jgi:hypothetical protein
LPYPSWFGGNVRGGDGKPSPYCERPCGHRGPRERDLYPRGSAGPALRPCGFSSGAGSCRAANKIIRILTHRAKIEEGYAAAQRGELIDSDQVRAQMEEKKRAWVAEQRQA